MELKSTILEQGIEKERLDLAVSSYLKGESIGRAVDVSQCNLWALLEEFKKRGITKRFDLDVAKELVLSTIAKNDPELQDKIKELKL